MNHRKTRLTLRGRCVHSENLLCPANSDRLLQHRVLPKAEFCWLHTLANFPFAETILTDNMCHYIVLLPVEQPLQVIPNHDTQEEKHIPRLDERLESYNPKFYLATVAGPIQPLFSLGEGGL